MKPKEMENRDYLMLPVELNFTSSTRQVKEILYRIETSSKYLKVVAARIGSPVRKAPETIQSFLTVAGFMRTEQKTES